MPDRPESPLPTPEAAPATRRVLVALVLLQALALLGYAALIVVEAVRGNYQRTDFVAIEAALFAVWAIGLGAAARSLARGQRGGFAPVLLTEVLLALAVGLPLIRGGQAVLGATVLVVAVLATALLLVTVARSPGE